MFAFFINPIHFGHLKLAILFTIVLHCSTANCCAAIINKLIEQIITFNFKAKLMKVLFKILSNIFKFNLSKIL